MKSSFAVRCHRMRRSGLITVLMFAGLAIGLTLGIVIHEDLTATLQHGGFFKPVVWLLLQIQTGLGIEPVARTGQFHFDWFGEIGSWILIRPLMLVVIPLAFLSVVLGVASIGDAAKLGLVG